MEETKVCNACGAEKPISEFYKLRADRPWRRSKCAECHRIRDKENREKKKLGVR